MKYMWSFLLVFSLLSCGGSQDSTDNFDITKSTESGQQKINASEKVDLENKGVGPIKSLELSESIDQELAKTGEGLFKSNCTICHKIGSKFVGPALKGVTDRRSSEWIMNMILNTEYMLRDDPLAKELFMEFNGSPMTNVGFEQDQARAVLEYLRTQAN